MMFYMVVETILYIVRFCKILMIMVVNMGEDFLAHREERSARC